MMACEFPNQMNEAPNPTPAWTDLCPGLSKSGWPTFSAKGHIVNVLGSAAGKPLFRSATVVWK